MKLPSALGTSAAARPRTPGQLVLRTALVAAFLSIAALAGAPSPARARADAPSSATEVRLHDKPVFSIRAPRAGQSGEERARAASRALEGVLEDPQQSVARVENAADSTVVFVGSTPVVTLGDDDARAAGGDVALHVYAASIASKIDGTLRAERRRSAMATSVFSFSLLVFSGVVAFLLFRRVGALSVQARAWVREHPDRIPALRLGRIEVVRPVAVRGAVSAGLALAHRIAEFSIGYSWLIFALSRFEATRDYTSRLAGFVLVPLSALIGRLGSALPLFVVAAVAAVALGVAVRFVDLFFAGVARGETHLSWLPADLAKPTSVLVRAGMVLVSIVLAAPLITGSDDGALSRAGGVALVALGLACAPVLACAAAGVPAVFGRRFKAGDFVEAGGRAGRVRDVSLLEIVLEDAVGCEVRVPQLLGLWHPTRVLGAGTSVVIEILVDAKERPAKVEEALVGAAGHACARSRVELVTLDVDGALWRVSGVFRPGARAIALADAVSQALAERGIALGRKAG